MKMISAGTKLVGLIGMPLSQTFAPRLHNEAYAGLNLDYYYFPIELPQPEKLPTLLAGLRLMNFGGMAVTKPFKVEILNHLDDIDKVARMMGACNTIKIEGDKWIGYNTDGVGGLRSLSEEIGKLSGLKYVSCGAGGAARSVCFELAQAGAASIVFADINEAAGKLAAELNVHFPGLATSLLVTETAAYQAAVRQADVLLNMSGLGMRPHEQETPLPAAWIEPRHVCFDATYNPHKTRFLLEAEQQGCQIINGLGMCKYQAAAQVELWTGVTGSEELMHQTLLDIIAEQNSAKA